MNNKEIRIFAVSMLVSGVLTSYTTTTPIQDVCGIVKEGAEVCNLMQHIPTHRQRGCRNVQHIQRECRGVQHIRTAKGSALILATLKRGCEIVPHNAHTDI